MPHHQKEDGTWNIKIRVYHNAKSSYIETQHFANQKQVQRDLTIKAPIILKMINPVIGSYRTTISKLGAKLSLYNAKKLANYLVNGGATNPEEINVIAFGRKRIEDLKTEKRVGSAANMQTVVNSLVDYFSSEVAPVTEIRAKMLKYAGSPQVRCSAHITLDQALSVRMRKLARV